MTNTLCFFRSKPTCLKHSRRGKLKNDLDDVILELSSKNIYLTSRKSVEFTTLKNPLKKATAKTRWEALSFY